MPPGPELEEPGAELADPGATGPLGEYEGALALSATRRVRGDAFTCRAISGWMGGMPGGAIDIGFWTAAIVNEDNKVPDSTARESETAEGETGENRFHFLKLKIPEVKYCFTFGRKRKV